MGRKDFSKEVIAHLERCSVLVGNSAKEEFDQRVFCEYIDRSIDSPIEQLFHTSMRALMEIMAIPRCETMASGVTYGMLIRPQFVISSYRVDFYIEWFGYPYKPDDDPRRVVVECDSQQWHERTEAERRYEKRRDRELAKLGLHTFRFTGKEIKEHPFNQAVEVCQFLLGGSIDFLQAYINDLLASE